MPALSLVRTGKRTHNRSFQRNHSPEIGVGIDSDSIVANSGHRKRKKRVRSTYPEAKAQELAIREAAAAYGVTCSVVSVREAKDQLSSILDRAERGEQIVVTSDGRPKAMIVRYRPMILGTKWTSHRALRQKTLILEDSTPIIREMRDSGY